jgi:hypothetical protein
MATNTLQSPSYLQEPHNIVIFTSAHIINGAAIAQSLYRAYTKEWCVLYTFTDDIAPLFCVCPVQSRLWAVESGIQFPAGASNFFLIQNLQTFYGAQAASYSKGTVVLSRGGGVMEVKRPGQEFDHSNPLILKSTLRTAIHREKFKTVSHFSISLSL